MIDRIITIAGTALLLAAVSSPAMAIPTLPEPATMSLFGLGVAGAYLAKRLTGRK
jgi:biotin transporter BioY